MTLSKLQKWVALGISIFTLIGMSYGTYTWLISTVVTKTFLTDKLEVMQKSSDIATNDLRLLIIEQGLSGYYTKGLENLTDQENHHYNKLVLAEATNETRRNALLGL